MTRIKSVLDPIILLDIFADTTALSAFNISNATNYPNFVRGYVTGVGEFYLDRTSTTTADGTNILSANGAGRWIKIDVTNTNNLFTKLASASSISFTTLQGNATDNTSLAASLNAKLNISSIINDLTSGGTTVPLSAQQGLVLKGLVDGKIDTASIVDTLVSTSTTTPLSANQGKVLKDLFDAQNAELAFLYSKVIWVDPLGNNTTGLKGNPRKPFQSIQNAISAAASGDTIIINTGTYTVNTTVTATNVHLVFLPGSTINISNTFNLTSSSWNMERGTINVTGTGTAFALSAAFMYLGDGVTFNIGGTVNFTSGSSSSISGYSTFVATTTGTITFTGSSVDAAAWTFHKITTPKISLNGLTLNVKYFLINGTHASTELNMQGCNLNCDYLHLSSATAGIGFSNGGNSNIMNVKKIYVVSGSLINSNGAFGFGNWTFNGSTIKVDSTKGVVNLAWGNSAGAFYKVVFNNCHIQNTNNTTGATGGHIIQVTGVASFAHAHEFRFNNSIFEVANPGSFIFYNTILAIAHNAYVMNCYSNVGDNWTASTLTYMIETMKINSNVKATFI